MATAKVSVKGWIVIPAHLRRKYGIEPGDEISIVDYGGVLSLVPRLEDPTKGGRGAIEVRKSLTGALLSERKRERKRERKK
jgi:AbrB family looped-hinge helix DNA binding protein